MTDRFQVSQSKVKKWRTCRLQYHLRYVEHLKRKVKSRPLTFGTIVHEMLEIHGEGGDPFKHLNKLAKQQKKLFAAEREEYGDIIEDIRLIMEEYFAYYENHDKVRAIKYNGKRTEHWLEVPVGKELLFVMKIDGFVKTSNGLRWILEHKTFSREQTTDDRWRNLQSSVYLKACEILGMTPFNGMLWNYIKSKPPTVPQMLQRGGLSIRQIDTLPSVVDRVIEENDLDPEKCKELIERARANVPNYFYRIYTPVNRHIVNTIFDEFIGTSLEILEYHGKKADRNIGQHCAWCDYEPICRAQLTGADADFVKAREYEDSDEEENGKDKAGKAEPKASRKGGGPVRKTGKRRVSAS